jgi:hypothetical protein
MSVNHSKPSPPPPRSGDATLAVRKQFNATLLFRREDINYVGDEISSVKDGVCIDLSVAVDGTLTARIAEVAFSISKLTKSIPEI